MDLMAERSYISDYNNSDEIKNLFTLQLYIAIEKAFNRAIIDVPKDEFQLFTIETLQFLKQELPKTLSILQKNLLDISSGDILKLYDESITQSKFHKKLDNYREELITNSKGKIYTVSEANKILGYSNKASIYNHIQKNNLKVNKLSTRKTIIFESELDNFLQRTYKISLDNYQKLSQMEKKALHKN